MLEDLATVGNRHTPLYDFHVAHDARMVAFAGWDLPLHYPTGIKAEHLATRTSCGLFDISHMGRIELAGSGADALLERLTPTDLGAIQTGQVRYSVFLNPSGGVIDDLMIARLDGGLQLVVNAARAEHDIALLRAYLGDDTVMRVPNDIALLAVQGPRTAAVLSDLGLDLPDLMFMEIRHCELLGVACVVSRCGYTGEDGFELLLPAKQAVMIAETLAVHDEVSLAGLGARDTLRLEAGLPLWGHELDQNINPIAAGLQFVLSKRRREAADFPGAHSILADLKHHPRRRLVGLRPHGARPVRAQTVLFQDRREVGMVSSGGFAPSLNAPAAMGFVDTDLAKPGTELMAANRGKLIPISVLQLPLVPHRYYRG